MISQQADRIRRAGASLVLLLLAAGCASQAPLPSAQQDAVRPAAVPAAKAVPARTQRPLGERAVGIAMRQLGVPYRYGGSNPRGFDCSGLVHYSYAKAGKSVPRTTGALWKNARTVAEPDLRAGDLLFFSISGKMSHVGLYIGGGRFVHAPSSGKRVSVADLDSDYYSGALLRAGRPQ